MGERNRPAKKGRADMLLHCVFLNFSERYGRAERLEVLRAIAALVPLIDGLEAVEFGVNIDVEGKSPDHEEGFVARFRDRAALAAYAEHPEHRALGARLVEMCEGGADGIVVYDLELA
ncbi:Dabb family protein [Pontivivens ytuae]|nr:Dabb family protein [Pontivivens ytuae]